MEEKGIEKKKKVVKKARLISNIAAEELQFPRAERMKQALDRIGSLATEIERHLDTEVSQEELKQERIQELTQ